MPKTFMESLESRISFSLGMGTPGEILPFLPPPVDGPVMVAFGEHYPQDKIIPGSTLKNTCLFARLDADDTFQPVGKSEVELIATMDGNIEDGFVLSKRTVELHLKTGKAIYLKMPITKIPNVAVGGYDVYARVTDSKSQVTTSAGNQYGISIDPPYTDLSYKAKGFWPNQLQPGQVASYNIVVRNDGNGPATETVTFAASAYLDFTPTLTPVTGTVTKTFTVKPFSTKLINVQTHYRKDFTPPRYWGGDGVVSMTLSDGTSTSIPGLHFVAKPLSIWGWD